MSELTPQTIDKILSLGSTEQFNYFDLDYTSKPIHMVKPPVIASVQVITLNALIDLYKSNFEKIKDEKVVFHITSETSVEAFSNVSDDYKRRDNYLTASVKDLPAFRFGSWLSQEDFIIALQANFVESGDRDYILKTASDVATDDKQQMTDNGVSQTVTAKNGVLVKEVAVKPRVKLSPYRTFREILQPESEFVFRIHRGPGGVPQFGLFEADGGAWKLTAMEYIKAYLAEELDEDSDVSVIY